MEKRRLFPLLFLFIFGVLFFLLLQTNSKFYKRAAFSNVRNFLNFENTSETNDYSRLINITNFNFTIINEPCNKNATLLLLVLVHSAPHNKRKRDIVRNTWGQLVPEIELLFVLAAVDSDKEQEEINKENQAYEDIIQGNFRDAYKNLTYKHAMDLKYAVYHCPQAKYVLKTDDDIFVNMPKVIDYIQTQLIPVKADNFMFCAVHDHQEILRPESKRKWAISLDEYPGTEYPTYCGGWGIIYSPDALFKIYKKVQVAPYFWIDDVHVTGTMAKDTNISHVSFRNLMLKQSRIKKIIGMGKKEKPKDYFLFGSMRISLSNIEDLWKILYGESDYLEAGQL